MNKTQVLQAAIECLTQNPLTASTIHYIVINWDDQTFTSTIVQEEGSYTENVDSNGDAIPIPIDRYNSVEDFLGRAEHIENFMLSLADNPVLNVDFVERTWTQDHDAIGVAKIIECLVDFTEWKN